MVKIVFVCLGNICRSPVAQAIFNNRIKELHLEKRFVADSAGTSNYHIGEPPDQRSVTNALSNDIKVEHNARQFTIHDFNEYHYILAMDHDNFRHIEIMAAENGIECHGLYLIRSFQKNCQDLDVPDPYFGGSSGFQRVFDILKDSNERFLEYLLKKHQVRSDEE